MKKILCLILALCMLLPFAVFSASAEGTTEVSESEDENYRMGYRLGYSDAIYDLGEAAHRYDRYNSFAEKDKAAYEYGYHYGYTEGKKYVPKGQFDDPYQKQLAIELEHLTVNGKQFSYEDYPLNVEASSPVVLGALEVGVNAKNEILEDYAFYLYLYNPFGEEVFSLDGNNVQFSIYDTVTYGFEADGQKETVECDSIYSSDWRFWKIKVPVSRTEMILRYNRKNERTIYIWNFKGTVYKIRSDGKPAYAIDKIWEYGDSFNMKRSFSTADFEATTGDSLTLQAQLHYTYWRADNPNEQLSGTYDQINTVYFEIPRSVYEAYDFIYSIGAKFLQLQTSPIVITNSNDFNGRTNDVLTLSSPYSYSEVGGNASTNLYYGKKVTPSSPSTIVTYDWYYGKDLPEYDIVAGITNKINERCDNICYYFYCPDLEYTDGDVFHGAVSSARFENWVNEFTDHFGGSISDLQKMLDFPLSSVRDQAKEALRLLSKYGDINSLLLDGSIYNLPNVLKEYDLIYNFQDVYELEEWRLNKDWSFFEWLKGNPKFWYENSSIQKFEVIENPSSVAAQYADNVSALGNKYYIGEADAVTFYEYLKKSSNVVVLLRFAKTDYECHELSCDSIERDGVADGRMWLVKQSFFRGVTVSDLTFKKCGDLICYKVDCEPINAYPGLSVKDDQKPLTPEQVWDNTKDQFKDFFKKPKDVLEQVKDVAKIIAIVLAAILILWLLVKFVVPLLAPIMSAVVTVVTAPFKAISKKRRKQKNDGKNETAKNPSFKSIFKNRRNKKNDGKKESKK